MPRKIAYLCDTDECPEFTFDVDEPGWRISATGGRGRVIACPAHQYSTCESCKRPMRRHGQLLKDHPGTVAKNSNKECGTCYARRIRGSEYMPVLSDWTDSLEARTVKRMVAERFEGEDDYMLILTALGIGDDV